MSANPPPPGRTAAETGAFLDATGISKRFGGVTALSDVSLRLPVGQVLGLIGPNGAGKSTFLSILAGAQRPDSGQVRFGRETLTGRGRAAAARAGVIQTFQQPSPIPGLTVSENVLVGMTMRYRHGAVAALGLSRRLRREQAGLRGRAEEILAAFGLAELARQDAAGLSFGQLRLLEIARAIAAGPRILLLDEPAAGLSSGEAAELARLIGGLRADGIGVLVVDHDVPFLFGICDAIVAMDFGRVIATGPPAVIEADEQVKAAYLSTEARPLATGETT